MKMVPYYGQSQRQATLLTSDVHGIQQLAGLSSSLTELWHAPKIR